MNYLIEFLFPPTPNALVDISEQFDNLDFKNEIKCEEWFKKHLEKLIQSIE